jgi:hypothetical protein
MGRPSKYPRELRERAVRMVFEHVEEHPSQWATIKSVAEKREHLATATAAPLRVSTLCWSRPDSPQPSGPSASGRPVGTSCPIL